MNRTIINKYRGHRRLAAVGLYSVGVVVVARRKYQQSMASYKAITSNKPPNLGTSFNMRAEAAVVGVYWPVLAVTGIGMYLVGIKVT